MSMFATMRRRKDRSKGAASHGTVLVSETKSEPIFNSTPNLHKISLGGKHAGVLPKAKESTAVFYPEQVEDVIEEDDSDTSSKYGGFGSRRSSSIAEGGDEGARKLSFTKNKTAGGILRHNFSSMVSMFGSLKRTKSTRKMTHGSSQDFGQEKREVTDYMRDRLTSSSTQSADSVMAESKTSISNMEPGVRSSSSGSDDDLHTDNDSFRKASSAEKEDDTGSHSDYTLTKTEEELKEIKIRLQGIKKFNMDPKKGVEFLVENGSLRNTPDDVAKFLFAEGKLSKTAIGNYLGEHIEFNEDVLQSFLQEHKFSDLKFVQALRKFLLSFRLPGESQKIDRMMEAFAKRYCEENPGLGISNDTCYLLSYSIIMLNTTLHNPSVKDKPTVEQFIQMNRDVDCGKSLNKAFLVEQYNSILTEPFKIPPEDANDLVLTFFNPNLEGWLWKQGGYKTWKRRWFILSNNCLYYFKFTTDKSPRGIIPLENVNAKEVSSTKSNELFPFLLYKKSSRNVPSDVIKTCKTLSNGTTVLSQYHTITVASLNPEDRRKWVNSINQNNSVSNFYDELARKKSELEASRQQNSLRGRRNEPRMDSNHGRTFKSPERVTRKLEISTPSTAPPELLTPAGPLQDPNNFFKKISPSTTSHASISSGSVVEPDSSYGSYVDIPRCKSESRILECTHSGSTSSVDHDTGSLGSRSVLSEEKFSRGAYSDIELRDGKFDLSKKLSVIEESQNATDRNSVCSGIVENGVNGPFNHIGYRKLSNDDFPPPDNMEGFDSKLSSKGASSSDSPECDNVKTNSQPSSSGQSKKTINELSTPVRGQTTGLGHPSTILLRYSRSGSIESDV